MFKISERIDRRGSLQVVKKPDRYRHCKTKSNLVIGFDLKIICEHLFSLCLRV